MALNNTQIAISFSIYHSVKYMLQLIKGQINEFSLNTFLWPTENSDEWNLFLAWGSWWNCGTGEWHCMLYNIINTGAHQFLSHLKILSKVLFKNNIFFKIILKILSLSSGLLFKNKSVNVSFVRGKTGEH